MIIPVFVHQDIPSPNNFSEEILRVNFSDEEIEKFSGSKSYIDASCSIIQEGVGPNHIALGRKCLCMYEHTPKLPRVVAVYPNLKNHVWDHQEHCFDVLRRAIKANPKTTFYVVTCYNLEMSFNNSEIDKLVRSSPTFNDQSTPNTVVPVFTRELRDSLERLAEQADSLS